MRVSERFGMKMAICMIIVICSIWFVCVSTPSSLWVVSAASETRGPSDWARAEVESAIELGIVPERLQMNYQQPITREEFAELIVNTVFMYEKYKSDRIGGVYWSPDMLLQRVTLDVEFVDAKQDHVKLAYLLGSINGISDTHFAPDRHITRQEAAMMLMNTSHLHNEFEYMPVTDLGYADYEQIADWAKPAVSAAASTGYMIGVGDRFDYSGKITREQAVLTVLRLYRDSYTLAIRGNLIVDPSYHELQYIVGKDYIFVRYVPDESNTKLKEDSYSLWSQYPTTQDAKDEFRIEHAVALFSFRQVTWPADYPEIIEPTMKGATSKWDYGYMTVSMLNPDSVIKFEYKPMIGYVSMSDGYRYGYPFQQVEVKQIEI